MKRCPACVTDKPRSEFNISNSCNDGLRTYCKPCSKVKNAAYERKPERIARLVAWNRARCEADPNYRLGLTLKRKFNMTLDEYKQRLTYQGGVCDMCRGDEIVPDSQGRLRRLCVDHCHQTGVVRGLLCQRCNLAQFPDDIAMLELRIAYLKRHQMPKHHEQAPVDALWMRN